MNTRKTTRKEAMKLTMEEIIDAVAILQNMINESEKYRNSYFWTPHSLSSSRRYAAFEHSYDVSIGDIKIIFDSSYSESCRHCYYQKTISINNAVTTLTKVKTVHNELINILDDAMPKMDSTISSKL